MPGVGGVGRHESWRHLVSIVALGTTALLLVATVMGFLGRYGWLFDLVANLRLQQALLLALLAVVLVVTGPRWAAALAVAGAGANLALLAPFLLVDQPPQPVDATATLNISFLNLRIREADPAALSAFLDEGDDDIVVLSSGTRRWAEHFRTSLTDMHVVAGPRQGEDLELIVLSRDPDVRVLHHRPARQSRSALIEVVADLDGQPVRVLGTHPVSPMTPSRAQWRDAQLVWIAAWTRAREDPLVVVGDLNTTPWSSAFQRLLERGGFTDSQRHHGLQPSWPAAFGPLGIPIDHVLHTDELVTVERELGPSFGSEHRMVRARIGLRTDDG